MYILSVILAIVGAIVCYNMAKSKNRNVVGWAIFGLIFPIVAVIWILCLKPIGSSDNNQQ